MLKTFQLSTALLFLVLCLYSKKVIDLKRYNALLKAKMTNTIKSKNKQLVDTSEQLTIYYLITLEQNNILEKFQSSRNEKRNNKKLTELMQKLN